MGASYWTANYDSRRVQVKDLGDGSFQLYCHRPNAKVDLSHVPDGTPLRIAGDTSRTQRSIALEGCRSGHRVTATSPMPITVTDGTLGSITFQLSQTAEATFSGATETLRAEHGTVELQEAKVDELVLAGGAVTGSLDGIANTVASGEARLPPELPRLTIDPAGASVSTDRNQPRIGVIDFSQRGALTVRPADPRSPRPLTVGRVEGADARIELGKGTVLVLSEVADLAVTGQGEVRVPGNETVTDLTLEGQVSLLAQPGSAVLRLRGNLRPVECRHASIVAAPGDAYAYEGLVSPGRTRTTGPDQLLGTTLRGIRINDNAAGRRLLRELREAAVVEPDVDRLRVRTLGLHWDGARLRHASVSDDPRTVDDSAFFAQELAALANEKSGSGSIRTKASWAAYRGRHLTATSKWERGALSIFRLVGYGQRPGPAFLSWLLLAALLAVPMLPLTDSWHAESVLSVETVRSWTEQALRLLLAPLVLLRLAGDPQLRDVSELRGLVVVLLQTVAAAPFAFAVVATGRFLRAEWPW